MVSSSLYRVYTTGDQGRTHCQFWWTDDTCIHQIPPTHPQPPRPSASMTSRMPSCLLHRAPSRQMRQSRRRCPGGPPTACRPRACAHPEVSQGREGCSRQGVGGPARQCTKAPSGFLTCCCCSEVCPQHTEKQVRAIQNTLQRQKCCCSGAESHLMQNTSKRSAEVPTDSPPPGVTRTWTLPPRRSGLVQLSYLIRSLSGFLP